MMRKKVCVNLGGQSIIFDTLSLITKWEMTMRKYVMNFYPRLYQSMLGYQVFKATLQSRHYFMCMQKESSSWI